MTVQNVRDKVEIRLSDRAAVKIAMQPIHYETGFTLLPGSYEIKVLVRDGESGRIGTFQTSFAIPNLAREEQRLPISSVAVGSQLVAVGDALFAVRGADKQRGNPLVSDGMKLLPSVSRVFSRRGHLYVFLQVYSRESQQEQSLVAYMTLFRNGAKVFETSPLRVGDGVDDVSGAVPIRFSVSLSSLPTGRYDCQVTVLKPASQKAAFWSAPLLVVQ